MPLNGSASAGMATFLTLSIAVFSAPERDARLTALATYGKTRAL